MKSIFLFSIILLSFTCKAQQVLPLTTFLDDIPANAHVKDLNNELNPYIGIYKANFEGNEITLYITKEENKLENSAQKSYYMDALIVKYIVKNSSGVILQDTQNNSSDIEFYSFKVRPAKNALQFIYTGTNCHVGWGDIYLKKINATQISWEYRPDDIITTAAKCPPTLDTTIYLPETKDLIFTKQ